jgi:hypothetical protein
MNKTTKKAVLLLSSLMMTLLAAQAHAQDDTKALEDQLLTYGSAPSSPDVPQPTLGQAMEALREAGTQKPAACDESKKLTFAQNYVVSYGQNGPCRIYDLSFPTLRTAFAGAHVAKIPLQQFKPVDYYNWITGHYSEVYQNISDYKNNFQAEDVQSSWASKIQFKSQTPGLTAAASLRSFHASDLEVGEFQFDSQSRAQLSQILSTQRALLVQSNMPSFVMNESDAFWNGVINNPQSLLQKIRFDWNATEKVFDVVLEGGFLPIAGPVALVDYNTQYKAFIESMTRSVMQTALGALTNLIPEPTTRIIVRLGIDQTFEFITQMYSYQTNRLEDSIRLALQGKAASEVPAADLDRGLNVLFGAGTDILQQYILTVAKGQKFDWNNLDKAGRDARYSVEKQRDIMNNNLHSKLAVQYGCNAQLFEGNFGICESNGQKSGVYSFMSSTTILFWNLDPVRVYNYQMPAEILLRRSTSLLMSMGLSVFSLPIPKFLINQLVSALHDFAFAAQDDESYLLNRLVVQKQTKGALDADSQSMLKWLYIQNINPFIPKTEAIEQAVVKANHNLLMGTK